MNKGSWFKNLCLEFVDNCTGFVSSILFIFLIYASWQFIKNDATRAWGIWLFGIGFLALLLLAGLTYSVIGIRNALKSPEERKETENTDNTPEECHNSEEAPAAQAEEPCSQVWAFLYVVFAVSIVAIFAYFITH